jgi:hypothetical protein
MVMPRDDSAKLARQDRLLAVQEQQQREQEERDKAPKRQVTLKVTYQETTKAAVPGVSPAVRRSVAPGEPVLVTDEEWQRLRQLDVIAATAGESPRGGQPQTLPGQVPGAVYDSSAQDVIDQKVDLDYAVTGIARHFQADADTVRTELSRRVQERSDAVTAAQKASGKSASEWDALPEPERARLVDAQLAKRQGGGIGGGGPK